MRASVGELVLPLDATKLKSVLVVGPTSDDISVQAHTYHGTRALLSLSLVLAASWLPNALHLICLFPVIRLDC